MLDRAEVKTLCTIDKNITGALNSAAPRFLLKVQRERFTGNKIFIIMFSLMYIHLKIRIVVFLIPQNELFISTEGVSPHTWRPPYYTAMFLQFIEMDKLNTCSREGLLTFTDTVVRLER